MARFENPTSEREDVLNWMQMEALGVKRRERITTSDYVENKSFTSVSQLEDRRKELGANYQAPEQGKLKIAEWKNIHRLIVDDGTAAPVDLRSVNEGLGQTHRKNLMDNIEVRTYTGDAESRKYRHRTISYGVKNNNVITDRKSSLKQEGRHRVTRERVVKGNLASIQPLPPRAKAPPSNITTPDIKASKPASRKDQDRKASASLESLQRQQRVINAPLSDPRMFLASYQGVKVLKSPGTQPLSPSMDAVAKTTSKILVTTGSKTSSIANLRESSIMQGRKESKGVAQVRDTNTKLSKEESSSSRNHQGNLPLPMPKMTGTVPLSYLMSLGLEISPEHIRLLKAHSIQHPLADSESDTSALLEKKNSSILFTNRPLNLGQTSIAASTSSKAQLVDYASSSSGSASASPVLAKSTVAATASPNPQGPITEAIKLGNSQQLTLNPIIVSGGPQPASASIVPLSEALRHQREMIIGPQVYKNRYSQVAGSLVEKFKAMTLTDPAPKSATKSTANDVAPKPVPSPTVGQSSPAARRPSNVQSIPDAAPLLRPRFIPNQSAPSVVDSSAPVLSPRSVNTSSETSMWNQPLRTKRSSGPSLPPHLRSKVANSDTGAAARAQYSSQ